MTDITELAQRMSIERIKQIALGATPIMGEREGLAITALHFAEELKIATDAFQAAGLAQLAAEEALEKAHQRIDELENDEVRQRLANAEHQLYMAELAKHNLKASRKAQFRKRRAAEKRIAELESKLANPVQLPKTNGYWTETEKAYEEAITLAKRQIRLAGFRCDEDEKRLDADVSNRNQPGMVVAVHIDVGDFVKFRGQVYEVKETDFDDHDVTLWFVCGKVLKCAAGCPIEVVSAPEEDE
ncbi:TPA: hypothetical protein ACF7XJ_001510 [Klebsiella pneumoniae]